MKRIKSLRDLDYQLEIVKVQRQVELDKLKQSIRKTRHNLLPSILTFALGSVVKRRKKKR